MKNTKSDKFGQPIQWKLFNTKFPGYGFWLVLTGVCDIHYI